MSAEYFPPSPRILAEPLLPRHREKLEREKAISADVIAEARYRSVRRDDPILIAAGFAPDQRADGYLIPNSPPDGSNGQYMLRRDEPRVSIDRETGKRRAIKMEQPLGQRHRLYVPKRCLPWLSDASRPLYITEGNDKANALASQGVCALSVPGVTIWPTPEILEKDWPLIELRRRRVLILFDSKAETNRDVGDQREKLAADLTERGARVRIVRIPDNPDGSEQKIDDYLAKGGSLADLLAERCEDWTPPAARACDRDACRLDRERADANAAALGLVHAVLSNADLPMAARAAFLSVWLDRRAGLGGEWANQGALAAKVGIKSGKTFRAAIEPFCSEDGPLVKVEGREEIDEQEYERRSGKPPKRPFPQGVMSVPRVRYDLRSADDQATLAAYLRVVPVPRPKPAPRCTHPRTISQQVEIDRCIDCDRVAATHVVPRRGNSYPVGAEAPERHESISLGPPPVSIQGKNYPVGAPELVEPLLPTLGADPCVRCGARPIPPDRRYYCSDECQAADLAETAWRAP